MTKITLKLSEFHLKHSKFRSLMILKSILNAGLLTLQLLPLFATFWISSKAKWIELFMNIAWAQIGKKFVYAHLFSKGWAELYIHCDYGWHVFILNFKSVRPSITQPSSKNVLNTKIIYIYIYVIHFTIHPLYHLMHPFFLNISFSIFFLSHDKHHPFS